jgi:hypothetical protein
MRLVLIAVVLAFVAIWTSEVVTRRRARRLES